MSEKLDLDLVAQLLQRTPGVLRAWLSGLSDEWLTATEGPETWNPFDVLGHLIHGERTDWIPRAEQILSGDSETPFQPFDRFAHIEENKGKGLEELLDEFESLRKANLERLAGWGLGPAELAMQGTHPAFGTVTLSQLMATWVTHDLTHLAQIARVMAKVHDEGVGPWKKYLSVLRAPHS
jgi:hypothetical protein